MEPRNARELMARQPPQLAGCLEHGKLPRDLRPDDCRSCVAEMRTLWRWLELWREDALDVLTRQDAALHTLRGYEPREQLRGSVDVVREDSEGHHEVLLAGG